MKIASLPLAALLALLAACGTTPDKPADGCDDADQDSVCDVEDQCLGFDDSIDADADGIPDFCDACPNDPTDADADGDGVCDDNDLCTGDDATGDGDLDGVCDDSDVCSGDDASGDTDGDGICDDDDLCAGDDTTGDTDSDGVCDDTDACPADALDDSDNDGSCDSVDLCTGDDTTGDTDSDGVCNDTDACPADALDDSDNDGSCDSSDLCTGDDTTGDADGDSVCDDIDVCPLDLFDDSDNDGSCDSSDLCTGNDTTGDTDNDGACDDTDICPLDSLDDSDNDGFCDSDDFCPADPTNSCDESLWIFGNYGGQPTTFDPAVQYQGTVNCVDTCADIGGTAIGVRFVCNLAGRTPTEGCDSAVNEGMYGTDNCGWMVRDGVALTENGNTEDCTFSDISACVTGDCNDPVSYHAIECQCALPIETCVATFDPAWAAFGENGEPSDYYSAYGVSFDNIDGYGLIGGTSNGDSSGWGLDGTNGPAAWGLWPGYHSIAFDSSVTNVSVDFIQPANDASFTVSAYNVGAFVGSVDISLTGLYSVDTATFAGPVDQVEWTAPSNFLVVDNVQYDTTDLTCPPVESGPPVQ